MKKVQLLCLLTLLISYLGTSVSCGGDNPLEGHLEFNLDELPLAKLGDYGFFEGPLDLLDPHPSVIPYDLNTPLFSDYSVKSRFVYMPKGSSATFSEGEFMTYPVGTILIKNFFFWNDYTNTGAGKRMLETRLLVKYPDRWQPYSYIWNSGNSEADFALVGGPVTVEWVHTDGSNRSTNYLIPNQIECENCHDVGFGSRPLGPTAANLNKDFSYADGNENQLSKWSDVGYLSGAPSDPGAAVKMAKWDDPATGDLAERARAYLDVNCGHCHHPDGNANNSGLFLQFANEDPTTLGVCKPPVAAGGGSGGLNYSIVPGKPDSSIMIYRMNSLELDEAMPELGRSVIHQEGLQLIRDWIESMPPDDC